MSKIGRHAYDKPSVPLFDKVIYIFDELIETPERNRLRDLLDANGGKSILCFNNVQPTLYISETRLYPHSDTPIHSVTPLWIDNAVQNGFVHEYKYYAPHLSNQFLSGIVITVKDLPQEESKRIEALVESYGGQYREELSQDITYLLCKLPTGRIYTQSLEYHIPALLFHWLDDCIRCHERLGISAYQLPFPTTFTPNSLPATLYPYPNMEIPPPMNDSAVLQDHVVFFASDIIMKKEYKKQLKNSIEKAGGRIAPRYTKEITIFIAKYRLNSGIAKAFKDGKIIGNLWWLSNTLNRGYLRSPLSTLLDYPIPDGGIPGMQKLSISITGYKGVVRDYIRRLLVVSGAMLNPTFDENVTHLICGGTQSKKYRLAKERGNVTIINHKWLEECFQQWHIIPCTDERYNHIPENNQVLNNIIGRTHLIESEVERWMKKETCPVYIPDKHMYKIVNDDDKDNLDEDTKGVLIIRKPRKAALRATEVLETVIIPDVNKFENEKKQTSRQGHRHQKKRKGV
ncbi:hypothetical protein BDB01DRAFT_120943 [Pilobolus umbonatus]|nr:hypothetical protein BDB01DRAFT_120943 [Pilobolus umbonatus]